MSNHLLLLFCLVFFHPRLAAQAPYTDYALSGYHARINSIDWQDGRTAAGGAYNDCDQAALWLFDRLGNLHWMRYLFDFGYSRADAVLFDRQGSIIAAGFRAEADDYPAPDDGLRVEKLDSLGNSRFLTFLFRGERAYEYFESTVTLLALPDGRYVAGMGSRLAWLSPAGDSLFSRDYGEHRSIDLALLDDSTIAVLAETDFSLLDLEGRVSRRFVHAERLRALHVRRDTAWYAGDRRLYYYGPGMSDPVSMPVAGLEKIMDLNADSIGLLLLGLERAGGPATAVRLTPSGAEETRLSFDRYRTLPRQLLYTPDGYLLGGNKPGGCLSLSCDYALGFIQRFPALSLPATPRVDLAIDHVAVTGYGTPDTIDSFEHPEFGTVYHIVVPVFLTFTFYNGGRDTVRSYALASQRFGGFNCAEHRFYREIESTAIAPGTYHTHPDILTINYFSGLGSFSYEGQFFTAAPNHHLDWAPENDAYAVQLITGREEAVAMPEKIKIYPNPAADFVTVETDRESRPALYSVALLDLHGRVVGRWEHPSVSPLPINRNGLPPGMYLLQLRTERGLVCRLLLLH